jgi:hypothetical protein
MLDTVWSKNIRHRVVKKCYAPYGQKVLGSMWSKNLAPCGQNNYSKVSSLSLSWLQLQANIDTNFIPNFALQEMKFCWKGKVTAALLGKRGRVLLVSHSGCTSSLLLVSHPGCTSSLLLVSHPGCTCSLLLVSHPGCTCSLLLVSHPGCTSSLFR